MTDPAGSTLPQSPSSPLGGVEVRIAVVEAAIRVFRRHALHEASPQLVAVEAGLPLAEVTGQFPSWNGLILAAIDRWNVKRMQPIMPLAAKYGTVVFLRGIVQANVDDPDLMRLLTAVINIAATPGHPMSAPLQSDWRDFHQLVQRNLARDIELGREPATMEPARGAEQLIALYEGLQLQALVRRDMDLLDSYDRAVTRLRHGWTRSYKAPTWTLDEV
ncbi:TetR/AcrR family transcriptional regulator [Frondihabitans cladoniiphilus]|uniref:TetR family transcriptional regulator n=1 Tax=Frondihabitans cladoniiphilus TaxID=715785 RepID=A0ABP8W4A8_9MICO